MSYALSSLYWLPWASVSILSGNIGEQGTNDLCKTIGYLLECLERLKRYLTIDLTFCPFFFAGVHLSDFLICLSIGATKGNELSLPMSHITGALVVPSGSTMNWIVRSIFDVLVLLSRFKAL